MKIGSPEYEAQLKHYWRSSGGVPMDQGMFAAWTWRLVKEREFREQLTAEGVDFELSDPPQKRVGKFKW